MRTYHGERTEQGCTVTVDGVPLRMQSDLSGNATTAFDWGFVGSGQLSLALLSDFLGDDNKARALCRTFEEEVIAQLSHDTWTMTEHDLAVVVAPLAGAGVITDSPRDDAASVSGTSFGDMPVQTAGLKDRAGEREPLPR